ncbi:MAG: hypothetical protein QM733_20675 [Ilumatobacteraceae bacterium]
MLDVGGGQMGCIAAAVFPAPAVEVLVGAAVAPDTGEAHPVFDATVVAVAAPEAALEVVVVDPLAFAGRATCLLNGLDLLEGGLVDECLVAALDQLFHAAIRVPVADVAEVVRVTEHDAQLGVGDRPCSEAPRSGNEATGGELVRKAFQGVVAGRIKLEGELDKLLAFGVKLDSPDFAAPGLGYPDVAVAEWCSSDGAAILDLLAHLVVNVGAARLRLVLVDRVQHCLDESGFRAVSDVDDGGDDAGAVLGEFTLGDTSIDAVAEDPVEVVDDDVVDVVMHFDPPHHLLEPRSLVDAGGGLAGLDELLDDLSPEAVRFALHGLPLGRDRDAFWVEVGVDLAWCADPQIDNCPRLAGSCSRGASRLLSAHV